MIHSATIQKEILRTVAYGDIFDYPLDGRQIQKFIGIQVSGKKLITALQKTPHMSIKGKMYYFLPRKETVVQKRLQKEKYNIEKIEKAKKIAAILSYIPTIQFIGVSGSLAMKNAEKKSDIDLFFITSRGIVWLSRLLVYLLLSILGQRRKRTDTVSEKVCANMFLSKEILQINHKKRNLYTAHEVMQILPLVNKNNTFENFLSANTWVKKYFPNVVFAKAKKEIDFNLLSTIISPLEYILRQLQLFHMKSHKTTEVTEKDIIAFHPFDYETIIMDELNKRYKKYGL